MPDESILGLLGLALRAGKLAVGDEPVQDLVAGNKARCIFLARDAGAVITKKLMRQQDCGALVLTLSEDKATLGAALGRTSCAVCATGDAGFAAAAAKKLAKTDETLEFAAQELADKQARILKRRGTHKKKHNRTAEAEPTEYIDIEEDEYRRRFEQGGNKAKPHK